MSVNIEIQETNEIVTLTVDEVNNIVNIDVAQTDETVNITIDTLGVIDGGTP